MHSDVPYRVLLTLSCVFGVVMGSESRALSSWLVFVVSVLLFLNYEVLII